MLAPSRLPKAAGRLMWQSVGKAAAAHARTSCTGCHSRCVRAAPSWAMRLVHHRTLTQKPAGVAEQAAFLGIFTDKEEQIALKNSNIDQAGIWGSLPVRIQESLRDPGRSHFVTWLGYGITKGKAAIIQLITNDEAAAIVACMRTDESAVGVMGAERVAELYAGRVNTSRHLISDKALAECFFQRMWHCSIPEEAGGNGSFLASMQFGPEVVAVNEKIRLVTTEAGGEHQKHADISERSDDGLRISRLSFQCYLNPERYQGGNFQLYLQGSEAPVDVLMGTGCAVVFVQEDPELMHGGGRKLGGEAKRAIRGNLDVMAAPEQGGKLG